MSVLGKIVGQLEGGSSATQVPLFSSSESPQGTYYIILCKDDDGEFFKGVIVFGDEGLGSMIDIVVSGRYLYGYHFPTEIDKSSSSVMLSLVPITYNDVDYIALKVVQDNISYTWSFNGAQASDPSIVQEIPKDVSPTERMPITLINILGDLDSRIKALESA